MTWLLACHFASPCLALPRLALPRLALPCLALPCLALPCLALPCPALNPVNAVVRMNAADCWCTTRIAAAASGVVVAVAGTIAPCSAYCTLFRSCVQYEFVAQPLLIGLPLVCRTVCTIIRFSLGRRVIKWSASKKPSMADRPTDEIQSNSTVPRGTNEVTF